MSRSGSTNTDPLASDRPARKDVHPLLVATALALACAVAIAACGGSSPKKSGGGSKAASASLAFSECMRSHGVTNFPDPSTHGGINLPAGTNPAAPSFRAARSACFHVLPGGGPGGRKASKQQIAQMVAMSECMRQHGVTGFPDPFAAPNGPPDLNLANYSSVEDSGGEVLAIPRSIDPNSPVFKQAAQTCNLH